MVEFKNLGLKTIFNVWIDDIIFCGFGLYLIYASFPWRNESALLLGLGVLLQWPIFFRLWTSIKKSLNLEETSE
jgi:hypothetical protein